MVHDCAASTIGMLWTSERVGNLLDEIHELRHQNSAKEKDTLRKCALLQEENERLRTKLRDVADTHQSAMRDVLAKGNKMEELMRKLLTDRNRLVEELTVLRGAEERRASRLRVSRGTETPQRASLSVGVQFDAPILVLPRIERETHASSRGVSDPALRKTAETGMWKERSEDAERLKMTAEEYCTPKEIFTLEESPILRDAAHEEESYILRENPIFKDSCIQKDDLDTREGEVVWLRLLWNWMEARLDLTAAHSNAQAAFSFHAAAGLVSSQFAECRGHAIQAAESVTALRRAAAELAARDAKLNAARDYCCAVEAELRSVAKTTAELRDQMTPILQ